MITMKRYIKSGKLYDYTYYPFLDTREYNKFLWFINTEAKQYGLSVKYYDSKDPNDLGGENRSKSNAVWVYDSQGTEIAYFVIQATKSDLIIDYDNKSSYFESFADAEVYVTDIFESVA